MKRTPLVGSSKPLRRGSLKKVGSRTKTWQKVRANLANKKLDEDGLIRCEDFKINLPKCGIARPPGDMDCHHIAGRDGDLLTDESNLLFLTRECHEKAHGR